MKSTTFFLCALLSASSIAQEPRLVPIPERTPTPRVRASDDAETAKAVITDPNGQPLPEFMPLGEMVVFSFKGSVRGPSAKSMKVIIEPPERAARSYFSDDMQTAYVPTGLKPVVISCTLIVAKGDIPDWTKISVKCGEGPIPPPDPEPKPKPQPDPEPAAKRLRLIVVDDALNPSTAVSAIKNDRKFWDGLKGRGHAFHWVAENTASADGKVYVQWVYREQGITKLPIGSAYLHIFDDATGKPLSKPMPLPPTDEIETLIKKYTGR